MIVPEERDVTNADAALRSVAKKLDEVALVFWRLITVPEETVSVVIVPDAEDR